MKQAAHAVASLSLFGATSTQTKPRFYCLRHRI
jgi:hypothetical protein